MMRLTVRFLVVALVGLVSFSQAGATTVTDFSNFNLTPVTETYEAWNTGTFTSGATDFRVQANNFGGGFKNIAPVLNAAGNTHVQLKLSVNPANVATSVNVVLFDNDAVPTQKRFEFTGLSIGPNQTLTLPLSAGIQAGTGNTTLDLTALSQFHVQGSFANGNPGVLMDMTFDDLSLIGAVPEPATLTLFGLASVVGIGLVGRRRNG